ncbi:MAG: IS1634 family transposase, partial [Candidatus Acidiferrales bacterium]
MPIRTGTAHVVTTTRKYKDQVYRTHLLRRSYREDGKVKNETLGNLSHLPDALIEVIRRSLQGETFVPLAQAFEVSASRAHGHVQAVAAAMGRLGLAELIGAKASRERNRVLAMVAARIVAPHTKLATTRWWRTTTLAEDFGVAACDENDLYAAMDCLLARQDRIQKKLAARHLSCGGLVLYDLSSSYFEGSTCPLAKLGYDRDGSRGLLQVNYGLLTDARGCPVAVSVHEGNVADSQTLLAQVQQLREDFGIAQLVMVGDRGMIGQKAIDQMRASDAIQWITALKSASIRVLVEQGQLQLGLFDERNLLELSSPDYPDERLVACRNPELAKLRAHKREELLAATERNLAKIKARVDTGKLVARAQIGLHAGKVINQYKVAKHFDLTIEDKAFSFARKREAIAAEAALDGVYIIRTSVRAAQMDAADCVRNYKALAHVERAFRSLKTIDLKVRPIHHRLAERVRAHIFLCMLAFYVEWH